MQVGERMRITDQHPTYYKDVGQGNMGKYRESLDAGVSSDSQLLASDESYRPLPSWL